MSKAKLFTPYKLTSSVTLGHRIFFGPCTRSRATPKAFVPQLPMMATYYEQRASVPGTLLITEGTCISEQGRGYALTPGIYSDEQVKAWSEIVKRVHDKKSFVFMQIWHVGRCSLSVFQPGGKPPVTSTGGPAPPGVVVFGEKGFEPVSPSRTLTIEEIEEIKGDYYRAAKNAIAAGCDGVEIHGANGYLCDQFLHDGVNKRTDKYGGSIENRARFHLEVVDTCIKAVGNERVGLRLSPYTTLFGITDSNYDAIYQYLLPELSKRKLAYVHFNEDLNVDQSKPLLDQIPKLACTKLRKLYQGTLLSCGQGDRESAVKIVEEGHADLYGFGRKFIANPDLPKRLELDAPMNDQDRATFFGGAEKGYTDYPFLN